MGSTYGRHTWFHQSMAFLSLFLLCVSYYLVDNKPCLAPLVAREEISSWLPGRNQITGNEFATRQLRIKNETVLANQIEYYIRHYYDAIQVCHIVLGGWCLLMIVLGIINIVPKHEDFKVCIISLHIILMCLMALFSFYIGFMTFQRPCHNTIMTPSRLSVKNLLETFRMVKYFRHDDVHRFPLPTDVLPNAAAAAAAAAAGREFGRVGHGGRGKGRGYQVELYKLEFRSNKDKRPVNVYEDEDETMIQVTLIDIAVGFVMLCSTFLYFFDSRQTMIEWRN